MQKMLASAELDTISRTTRTVGKTTKRNHPVLSPKNHEGN
jgi:hypothetical protein